MEHAVSEQLEK